MRRLFNFHGKERRQALWNHYRSMGGLRKLNGKRAKRGRSTTGRAIRRRLLYYLLFRRR